jgi:hypothetical protein
MINKVLASARVSGWAVAAVSAACLGLACVGCATAATPTSAPSAAASQSVAPAAAAPSATASAAAGPVNLVADAAVQQDLLAAFIAFRSNAANTPGYAAISPSAVAGITPGTLYYALDPATGTYWAAANFSATAAASQTMAFVGFQDGGSQAVFMQSPGEPWEVKSVGPCLAGLPTAIAAIWALTQSAGPMCPSGVPAA